MKFVDFPVRRGVLSIVLLILFSGEQGTCFQVSGKGGAGGSVSRNIQGWDRE